MNASENQSLSFHGCPFGASSRLPWRTDGRAAGPGASEVKRRRLAGVRCPDRRHAPSERHGPRTRAAQRGGWAAFFKNFLCIFGKTDSENFVCRISVSPPVPPQIGARPPPPLRCPLPGFCGERRARGGARVTPPPLRGPLPSARTRRGQRTAARSAQAAAHPRYAAPSLARARWGFGLRRGTDARSAAGPAQCGMTRSGHGPAGCGVAASPSRAKRGAGERARSVGVADVRVGACEERTAPRALCARALMSAAPTPAPGLRREAPH